MKQRQLVPASSILRIKKAAEQAWHDRNLNQCIELLERAIRLAPADISILLQLGRMRGLCYQYTAAEDCFEKAIRLAPKKPEILAAVALQARDFYNTEMAQQYLHRAMDTKQLTPEVLLKLADVCERLRRVDDAISLTDQALHLDPQFHPARLIRARIAHQKGRLEEAEGQLRICLQSPDREMRAKALYELGSILDKQRRYDEAMPSFLEAKRLLQPNAAPYLAHLQKIRAHLRQMREQLSTDLFKRWIEFGHELQPQHRLTLLCGHPRSGTTLLEQVLDSHPEIASAEETTHFTDYAYTPLQQRWPIGTPIAQILDSSTREALLSSRQSYIKASELCLAKSLQGKLLIDKNPSLTLMLPAVIRVFPEVKLLVALRDPRDVCLSCFMQAFVPVQQGSSAYLSLEETVQEYVELMTMWQTVATYTSNPSLVVRYEEMVDDLKTVAQKTLQFLDMPWNEQVLEFDAHAREKVVRSPTYADVTQKIFKRARGRWRNYQKYLEPHLIKLEPFVKSFGYE